MRLSPASPASTGGGDPALGSRKPAAKPRRDGKDTGDIPRVVMGQEVIPARGAGAARCLSGSAGGIAGGARRCAGLSRPFPRLAGESRVVLLN